MLGDRQLIELPRDKNKLGYGGYNTVKKYFSCLLGISIILSLFCLKCSCRSPVVACSDHPALICETFVCVFGIVSQLPINTLYYISSLITVLLKIGFITTAGYLFVRSRGYTYNPFEYPAEVVGVAITYIKADFLDTPLIFCQKLL